MSREFHVQRRVSFAETDMAGVMHFSNYFRIMEEVEHAFWRSLGLNVHFEEAGAVTSWPRVSATCDYVAPARFDDMLDLVLRVEKLGDKSLTLAVDFRRSGQRIALARETAVCCRLESGRFEPIPIPADIRARLEAFAAGTTPRG